MTKPTHPGTRRRQLRDLLRAFPRQTSGVAALELVLIAPFLALLLVGVVDYGTVISRQMSLASTVRAGVQYATIRRPIQGDVSAIRQAVLAAAPAPLIGSHDPQVTLYCECPNGTTVADCDPSACGGTEIETYIDILLEEDYPLTLSYPGFQNPIHLTERVTMRLN